jgi:hypothetical protein
MSQKDWSKMGRAVAAISLVLMLTLGGRALAGVEIVSDQPAATLLLPYFEVNLTNPSAATTLLSINDSSATAMLAHVVIWSDLSVPVLQFNVYLTGYDVYHLNLQSLLINGTQPQTASAGQDPSDTISPKGSLSQDINFASCTGKLPNPKLTAQQLTDLQDALTGNPSAGLGNKCAGVNHGDRIARGYITVDAVNNCTTRFPGDVGYFGAGGTGDATNQNTLWGDAFYINKATNKAFAQPLVHVLASATDPATSTSGRYTFYGRYDGFTAVDNRQPLSTSFAARYINATSAEGKRYFSSGTSMIVWRDSKVAQSAFTCPAALGSTPAWYGLGQEGIAIFDEQEHPQIPKVCKIPPCPPSAALVPFPAETQRIKVGASALPTTFDAGWMFLDLNTTVPAAGSNPPIDPAAAQAWVITLYDNSGLIPYRVGERAILLDSAIGASHFFPH